MTPISSLQNPRVKQIRALHARKERSRSGLCFAPGLQLTLAAFEHAARVELLVVAPELLTSPHGRDLARHQRERGLPCLDVTAAVFASLTDKEDEHGIGVVVRQRWSPLADIRPDPAHALVLLDGVQYPGNLGTILRTCDAAGAGGVVLVGTAADPYDPAALRASTGAVFSQPLARACPAELAAWKRQTGLRVLGAAPGARDDYRAARYDGQLALALGSEARGLSPGLLALCDTLVRIPMVGHADSLNLAVSAGLLLYEVFRQQHPLGMPATS